MMKKYIVVGIALVASLAQAVTWETGTMTVEFKDIDGNPIKNATLQVSVLNKVGWTIGGESDYKIYEAKSDADGVATVSFKFFHPNFSWSVITPSHYSAKWNNCKECFDYEVERSDYYENDPNTEDGQKRLAELRALDAAGDDVAYLQKFEPKKVVYKAKSIRRSIMLHPKKNPQPMYAHYNGDRYSMSLPVNDFDLEVSLEPKMCKAFTMITNGNQVIKQYLPVELDLKKCDFLPPWGGRGGLIKCAGKVPDIKIIRFDTVTNNVSTYYGWIEFGPGGGAYKVKKRNDDTFVAPYTVDPNVEFRSRIPYQYHCANGKWVDDIQLLGKDECMVLRTRAVLDENGSVTNCNYSVIEGPMYIGVRLIFRKLIFNPRVNDTNLEIDYSKNLSKPIWRNSGIDQW